MQIYRHFTWDNRFLPGNTDTLAVGHDFWSKTWLAGFGDFPISSSHTTQPFSRIQMPKACRAHLIQTIPYR